jgi:hypothetical protein
MPDNDSKNSIEFVSIQGGQRLIFLSGWADTAWARILGSDPLHQLVSFG